MPIDDQLLLIRSNGLFAMLSDEDIESLQLIHHFKETEPNDYIYFEHQYQHCLFFLKEGFVEIGYVDAAGNAQLKELIGPGDVFGNLTLLPGSRPAEYARARQSRVSLCMFRQHDFRQLLARRPDLALHYNAQLGLKLTRFEGKLMNLLHRDVRQRLLHFLADLPLQFPQYCQGAGFLLPHHLPHEDLARLIGSSRQSVSEGMAALKRSGVVLASRRQLHIPDVSALRKLLDVG